MLPALVNTAVVVVGNVGVDEIDAAAAAFGREAQDQGRVEVAFLPAARAPGLHDQPAGNGVERPASQHAAERTELGPRPRADDHPPAGDRLVLSGAEIHRIQIPGWGWQGDCLLDDLRHGEKTVGPGILTPTEVSREITNVLLTIGTGTYCIEKL